MDAILQRELGPGVRPGFFTYSTIDESKFDG